MELKNAFSTSSEASLLIKHKTYSIVAFEAKLLLRHHQELTEDHRAEPLPREEGELVWPTVARGKRSRQNSPATTAVGKGRWTHASLASMLDYSGDFGYGSAASTSGGEDAFFFSRGHRPVDDRD
ncbi:hypothetical protein GUJ93_ZPchr0013g36241 [Zizania palustris]|uniref:Uncharacterized protein n=1 Tax=Zizania palustris TaxID=103762 RepID=A0A8J6BYU4_ZIZPA|nr:hypothetical protein GUJ93_ZPchr0013g36241 [Zizania palustris]